MKRLAALFVAAVLLSGCAQPKVICGVEYGPYGLLNHSAPKDIPPDDLIFDVRIFLVVLTVVAPIYFGGFSLFQPVGKRPAIKGATAKPDECK